jgi:hypothetical protein
MNAVKTDTQVRLEYCRELLETARTFADAAERLPQPTRRDLEYRSDELARLAERMAARALGEER